MSTPTPAVPHDFITLPAELLTTKTFNRLSAPCIHTMVALYSFADNTDRCWPSIKMLSQWCRKPTSAVSKAIRKLHNEGWITAIVRDGGKTIYHLRKRTHQEDTQRPRLTNPALMSQSGGES